MSDNYDWVPEASKEWDEYELYCFLAMCVDGIARSEEPKTEAQNIALIMQALDLEIRMRGATCRHCKTNCVKCCGPVLVPAATQPEEWLSFAYSFPFTLTERECTVVETVSAAASKRIEELQRRIAFGEALAKRNERAQRWIQEYLARHSIGVCGENIYEALYHDACRLRRELEEQRAGVT